MLPISTVFSALLLMGTTQVSADELNANTALSELESSKAQIADGYGDDTTQRAAKQQKAKTETKTSKTTKSDAKKADMPKEEQVMEENPTD